MAFAGETRNSRWPVLLAVLFASIGVVRIVSTYSQTAQAFDEICHVAAAIELLDHHTYTLDPVHPPLSRIAIGLPLYLAGERYPHLPLVDHDITYNDVGNAILYDSGHYLRNLKLARLGVLPFFLLATAIVFLWARREYGDLAAVMAAALFTTLPNILAFSSIAYTDIVAASTQVALFFAFVQWLDKPTKRSALWFGLAAGLALASKATTLIFFSRRSCRDPSRQMDLHSHGRRRECLAPPHRPAHRNRPRSRKPNRLGHVWLCGAACARRDESFRRVHAFVPALPSSAGAGGPLADHN